MHEGTAPDGPSDDLWIKAMYPGGKRAGSWWLGLPWIHDRHVMVNGTMKREPSYRVGDRIALYVADLARLPAIFRVTGVPHDGRDAVRALYGEQDAERYGWVTPIEVLRGTSIEAAPPLEILGITSHALQNGRVRVHDREAFAALEQQLPPVGTLD